MMQTALDPVTDTIIYEYYINQLMVCTLFSSFVKICIFYLSNRSFDGHSSLRYFGAGAPELSPRTSQTFIERVLLLTGREL